MRVSVRVCDLIHCVLICADLLATWLYSPFPTLYQKVRSLPGSSSVIHCHWHEKQADYYCNGVDGLRILFKKEKETDRTNSCDRNSLIFFFFFLVIEKNKTKIIVLTFFQI